MYRLEDVDFGRGLPENPMQGSIREDSVELPMSRSGVLTRDPADVSANHASDHI